jgi:hypothetical protein
MNPKENQRFSDKQTWNDKLNKIRDLSFNATQTVCQNGIVDDCAEYHAMLGGILQKDTCIFPSKSRLMAVMDCANAIAIYEDMNHMYPSGLNKLLFKQQKGYVLRSRTDHLRQKLEKLERDLKLEKLLDSDIIKYFSSSIEGGFKEEDLYKMESIDSKSGKSVSKRMQIVVSERLQKAAYQKIMTFLLDNKYDVEANDEYKGAPDKRTECETMAEQEGLSKTVNLKAGSIRWFTDNGAGRLYTSGQMVEIISYDSGTDELMVRPFDVTGRGYHYPITRLKRLEKKITVGANTLTRKQFPVSTACALVVNSIAGLTLTNTTLVYDNSGIF